MPKIYQPYYLSFHKVNRIESNEWNTAPKKNKAKNPSSPKDFNFLMIFLV